jgi:Ala-tRNA(Pro) deacylase
MLVPARRWSGSHEAIIMRVAVFLQQQQVDFEFLPHAPAYSAPQRAKHLRLPGAQVAKAVLLRGEASFYLAVLPSTHQVDTELLSQALAQPIRLANDREMADVFRDCEFGVVPPFGTLYGLPTLLDEALEPNSTIVFEGQTSVEAIRLRCQDYERLERPRRLRFAYKQRVPGLN